MFQLKIKDFAFLIGLVAGLIFISFQVVGFSFSHFPGDLGDGRLVLYFLEHAYKYFTFQIDSFWSAPFMYPEAKTIAYSENLIGSMPFYAIFRVFGFDPFTAYQLWYLVVAALNFLTCYFFLKYVFKNPYAAILGAMVFAFSMALQSQLTHAQTVPRFAIPLAFWMLVKFKDNFEPKYFFAAVLFVVYQIYCGIYLGFMLIVPFTAFLILMVIQNYEQLKINFSNKIWKRQIIKSLLINVVILAPLIIPYLGRNIAPNFKHYLHISNSIPTLISYFYSQQGSLLWDFLSETGAGRAAWWDHQIFTGGISTICFFIVLGIISSRLYKTRMCLKTLSSLYLMLFAGFITFFIFLRIESISAYIFIYFLPGFSSMRSLTRIINIELLFFAISTAWVFKYIFDKAKKLSFVLFLIFVSLFITDNYFYRDEVYITDKNIAISRTNIIDSLLSTIPKHSIISYEPACDKNDAIYFHIDAMLAAQKHNLYSVNGYTASCPGDYAPFWDNIDEISRNNWLSSKDITFDTLYVVKSSSELIKIHRNEICKSDSFNQQKLNDLIKFIRGDEKWMQHIEQKAKDRNIPLDSMILLDAIWTIENQKK